MMNLMMDSAGDLPMEYVDPREAGSGDWKDVVRARELACDGPDGIGCLMDLGLSVRGYNCLYYSNLCCIAEVDRKTDAELLRIKNLGKITLREIRHFIAKYRGTH